MVMKAQIRIALAMLSLSPLVFMSSTTSAGEQSNRTDKSGYLDVIEQELARLNIDARCDRVTMSCTYTKTLTNDGGVREVNLRYSQRTDTVYIFIKNFLALEETNGLSGELARLLLSLNRELVTAKFEWDKGANVIRLSTTINTDSNLDRRSLRSQLIGLWSVADDLWPRLKKYDKTTKKP